MASGAVFGRCWDCGCKFLVLGLSFRDGSLGFELWRRALEASAADGSFRMRGLAAGALNMEVDIGGFGL